MTVFVHTRLLDGLGVQLLPDQDAPEPQYRVAGQPKDLRASVSTREGEILAALALGKRVLEIGTGLGVSTVYLASTALAISTVDPADWVHENVKLHEGVRRYRLVEEIPQEDGFDMAFIDGEHTTAAVRADTAACIDRGCRTIAYHDSLRAEVSQAIGEVRWKSKHVFRTIGPLMVCTR